VPTPPPEVPPYEPWSSFDVRYRAKWDQGQHAVFVGPAGSGKTVAARTLARRRTYRIALGTKMRDPEMDAYLEEGYVRVETWPPPPKAMRVQEDGTIRLVLWPKIQTRAQLRSSRPTFAACLDDCLTMGGWTIVADEGLWISARDGLNLGDQLSAVAYTGRSSGVTLMMLVQRPRGVPVHTWSNASHAFIWHAGNTDDLRELASLGTYRPRDVAESVHGLRGHDFLYLPCRGGSEWAVSCVDLNQARAEVA
jgi:hypothetical protein